MQASRCEKINNFFLVGNELNIKCNFAWFAILVKSLMQP